MEIRSLREIERGLIAQILIAQILIAQILIAQILTARIPITRIVTLGFSIVLGLRLEAIVNRIGRYLDQTWVKCNSDELNFPRF